MHTTYLIPEYYQKFACVGAACEMSCCNAWTVSMDRDDYAKLKGALADGRLAGVYENHTKKQRGAKRRAGYAVMTMDRDGNCPFLEEGLCAAQKQYGADVLPDVCRTYPRAGVLFGDVMERSLTLSCPEAARLCLLPREPMEFLFAEPLNELLTLCVTVSVLVPLFWPTATSSTNIIVSAT